MNYFTSSLLPQLGAHPISTSTLHLLSASLLESCTIHLYYSLPPIVFLDTHELSQRSLSYSFEYWGTRDLERPVHALPDKVSELLINVKIPEGSEGKEDATVVQVEVPMHLRYGRPRGLEDNRDNQAKPYQHIAVDWPQAFFQCPPSVRIRYESSPPYIPSHILATLPSSTTDSILLSIPPHSNFSNTPQYLLSLPLGNPQDLSIVEPLTALTIIACFVWLLMVSWKAAIRLHARHARHKTT